MSQLIAIYTDAVNDYPYQIRIGLEDLLVEEMEHLATISDPNGFTPEFAVAVEDLLLGNGYAVTSPWSDETDFWFASLVATR